MGLTNQTNLNSLPVAEEIVNGDLLIVQKNNGQTSILDFANFVIGPSNASFYTQIASVSSNLVSLSSNINTLTAYNQSQINSLSATIANNYNRFFYVANSTTVTIGQTQSPLITINNVPVALNQQDITLTCGNSPSSSVNMWVTNLTQSGSIGNYTYTFYININTTLSNTFTVLFNIAKPY